MKIRNKFVSNSSSSSFIVGGDYSIEGVKHYLEILLDFYNDFFNAKLSFREVFGDLFIATKEYENRYNSYTDYGVNMSGKIVISSESDNTIPFQLWELIIDKFDAERCYHG